MTDKRLKQIDFLILRSILHSEEDLDDTFDMLQRFLYMLEFRNNCFNNDVSDKLEV